MTTDQMDTLILKDQAGGYYVLPQAVLERGRVPAEHRAELERLLAAATQAETDGADAKGYVAPIAIGIIAATTFWTGWEIGRGLGHWYESQVEQVVPTIDLGSVGSGEPLPEY